MQVQTYEVPVFGESDRAVWVAQFEGFPNSQGVAEKEEDAIAELKELLSSEPERFTEDQMIPGF